MNQSHENSIMKSFSRIVLGILGAVLAVSVLAADEAGLPVWIKYLVGALVAVGCIWYFLAGVLGMAEAAIEKRQVSRRRK